MKESKSYLYVESHGGETLLIPWLPPNPENITTSANNAELGTIPLMPAKVAFVVLGQCYSMKNNKIRGRFKHPKCVKFELDFALQVPAYAKRNLGALDRPLRSNVTVYYPSRKQDLDCAIVYDLLQNCGVVSNDRHIIEKHEYGAVDAVNPRVEIQIEEI